MQQLGEVNEVIIIWTETFWFFSKNVQLFYITFKSYPSLLKSPEFMALGVSKHASSTPALEPPSWLLNHSLHNFNETTSLHQIHILCPSLLPEYSALAFQLFQFKVKHLYLLQVFPYLSKLWWRCCQCLLF